MELSENAKITYQLACVVLFPFFLQASGVFSPYWVSSTNCDAIGLMYRCCSNADNDTCENTKGADELDVRVLGLEATALAMMFLSVSVYVFGVWREVCANHEGEFSSWSTVISFCLLFQIIGGVFGFCGCMIVVGTMPSTQLGWSLYVCLVAGCLVIFMSFIACICYCRELYDYIKMR